MRTLLVFGTKTFKITVPDEAKITFGPWSPPSSTAKTFSDPTGKSMAGTLRIYESPKTGSSILAVFSNVTGYRDLAIGYEEEVAREEGAIIWKSDESGYRREEKVKRQRDWLDPQLASGEETE